MDSVVEEAASVQQVDHPESAELIELVDRIVRGAYSHDYEPLFSCAAPDCTLVTARGPTFSGLDDMRANLGKRADLPDFIVRDAQFSITRSSDPDDVIVVGTFTIYSDFSERQVIVAENQMVSMCLRKEDGAWQIYLAHFSTQHQPPAQNEERPLEMGERTYRYVQAILRAGRHESEAQDRISIVSSGTTVFVNPRLLIYAEAAGKTTVLHLTNGTTEVRQLLSVVEELLPGQFLRISRKHVINVGYVERIENDAIVLADGARLPLPKRRAQELRQAIIERARDLRDKRI